MYIKGKEKKDEKKNQKNMVLVTAEGREKSRPPGQLDSEYIHTCKAVVIIQGRVFRDKATPRYFVLWVAVADFFIVGGGVDWWERQRRKRRAVQRRGNACWNYVLVD